LSSINLKNQQLALSTGKESEASIPTKVVKKDNNELIQSSYIQDSSEKNKFINLENVDMKKLLHGARYSPPGKFG
jgi:hypothetical protein